MKGTKSFIGNGDILIQISEIFTSIQGESTYAGLPCTFIRLSGCSLRCLYCDTTYAYEEGEEYTIDSLVDEVVRADAAMVEVTGGEPLEQDDTPALVAALLDKVDKAGKGFKKKVLVETNGSRDISVLDPRAIVIMDIKTPGSGEAGSFDLHNIDMLKPSDEVKFVLTGREDYEWARSFLQEHDILLKSEVLFSPVFGSLEPAVLARWILDDALTVRLNLQLHKYIFGPNARGV